MPHFQNEAITIYPKTYNKSQTSSTFVLNLCRSNVQLPDANECDKQTQTIQKKPSIVDVYHIECANYSSSDDDSICCGKTERKPTQEVLEKLNVAKRNLMPIIEEIVNFETEKDKEYEELCVSVFNYLGAVVASKLIQEVLCSVDNTELEKLGVDCKDVPYPNADPIVGALYCQDHLKRVDNKQPVWIGQDSVLKFKRLYVILKYIMSILMPNNSSNTSCQPNASSDTLTVIKIQPLNSHNSHINCKISLLSNKEQCNIKKEYRDLSNVVNMLKTILSESAGSCSNSQLSIGANSSCFKKASSTSTINSFKFSDASTVSGAKKCILDCLEEFTETNQVPVMRRSQTCNIHSPTNKIPIHFKFVNSDQSNVNVDSSSKLCQQPDEKGHDDAVGALETKNRKPPFTLLDNSSQSLKSPKVQLDKPINPQTLHRVNSSSSFSKKCVFFGDEIVKLPRKLDDCSKQQLDKLKGCSSSKKTAPTPKPEVIYYNSHDIVKMGDCKKNSPKILKEKSVSQHVENLESGNINKSVTLFFNDASKLLQDNFPLTNNMTQIQVYNTFDLQKVPDVTETENIEKNYKQIYNVCSSKELDLDEIYDSLRLKKAYHSNETVKTFLQETGVEDLLWVSRPAKCCRRSFLNERSKQNIPYSVSVKSLPLDIRDIHFIRNGIKFQKTTKQRKLIEAACGAQLDYYINLVSDVYSRESLPFNPPPPDATFYSNFEKRTPKHIEENDDEREYDEVKKQSTIKSSFSSCNLAPWNIYETRMVHYLANGYKVSTTDVGVQTDILKFFLKYPPKYKQQNDKPTTSKINQDVTVCKVENFPDPLSSERRQHPPKISRGYKHENLQTTPLKSSMPISSYKNLLDLYKYRAIHEHKNVAKSETSKQTDLPYETKLAPEKIQKITKLCLENKSVEVRPDMNEIGVVTSHLKRVEQSTGTNPTTLVRSLYHNPYPTSCESFNNSELFIRSSELQRKRNFQQQSSLDSLETSTSQINPEECAQERKRNMEKDSFEDYLRSRENARLSADSSTFEFDEKYEKILTKYLVRYQKDMPSRPKHGQTYREGNVMKNGGNSNQAAEKKYYSINSSEEELISMDLDKAYRSIERDTGKKNKKH